MLILKKKTTIKWNFTFWYWNCPTQKYVFKVGWNLYISNVVHTWKPIPISFFNLSLVIINFTYRLKFFTNLRTPNIWSDCTVELHINIYENIHLFLKFSLPCATYKIWVEETKVLSIVARSWSIVIIFGLQFSLLWISFFGKWWKAWNIYLFYMQCQMKLHSWTTNNLFSKNTISKNSANICTSSAK